MKTGTAVLRPDMHSKETLEFENQLRAKVVGQDAGIEALVELYQIFCASLSAPNRPAGTVLLLGPTGTGKTRLVEAAAEILFGNPRALIKVDCAEYQHAHEISKLIGSPPGYLGHRETHPLLTQDALREFHTDKLKLSFLLFYAETYHLFPAGQFFLPGQIVFPLVNEFFDYIWNITKALK